MKREMICGIALFIVWVLGPCRLGLIALAVAVITMPGRGTASRGNPQTACGRQLPSAEGSRRGTGVRS